MIKSIFLLHKSKGVIIYSILAGVCFVLYRLLYEFETIDIWIYRLAILGTILFLYLCGLFTGLAVCKIREILFDDNTNSIAAAIKCGAVFFGYTVTSRLALLVPFEIIGIALVTAISLMAICAIGGIIFKQQGLLDSSFDMLDSANNHLGWVLVLLILGIILATMLHFGVNFIAYLVSIGFVSRILAILASVLYTGWVFGLSVSALSEVYVLANSENYDEEID